MFCLPVFKEYKLFYVVKEVVILKFPEALKKIYFDKSLILFEL